MASNSFYPALGTTTIQRTEALAAELNHFWDTSECPSFDPKRFMDLSGRLEVEAPPDQKAVGDGYDN